LSSNVNECQPLVSGLVLLNATPFWGFVPPAASRPKFVQALLPWDGALPAPGWISRVVLPYWVGPGGICFFFYSNYLC
jgi:hypothetical protein